MKTGAAANIWAWLTSDILQSKDGDFGEQFDIMICWSAPLKNGDGDNFLKIVQSPQMWLHSDRQSPLKVSHPCQTPLPTDIDESCEEEGDGILESLEPLLKPFPTDIDESYNDEKDVILDL